MINMNEYETDDPLFQGRHRETERKAFGDVSSSGSGGGSRQENTEQVLRSLDGDMVAFRGCIDSIGTNFDGTENRKELKRLRSIIKRKIAETDNKLKKDKKRKRSPNEKIIFERMSQQLAGQVTTFQQLLQQDKTAEELHSSRVNTPAAADDFPDYQIDQGVSPPPRQVQAQFGADEVRLREMEHEDLQDLERDILDLRDIQQDIAVLVQEQGEDIDRIDQNVAVAQGRVEHGAKETSKAVDLQKKNRKVKFIIAAVLITVAVVIIVVAIILIAVLVPRNS